MFSRPTPIRRLVVVAVIAMLAGVEGRGQLAATSPFLPSRNSAVAAPTANAPLEYRGLLTTSDGRTLFRLYDPAKKAGTWLALNERGPDFNALVKQYDPSQETVTVEHDGKTLTLAERKAKIVTSGAVPPMMPTPATANTMPAAVTQSVVLNPTPAQEAQRLEAVAAEVARRRALREQAAQQNAAGAPAQPVPPPAAANVQVERAATPAGAVGPRPLPVARGQR
jgi:hypothetical protein